MRWVFNIRIWYKYITTNVYSGEAYRITNGAEDEAIVRNVQLGLESRSFDRGPLILTPEPRSESENAVADFQNRYLAAMEAG